MSTSNYDPDWAIKVSENMQAKNRIDRSLGLSTIKQAAQGLPVNLRAVEAEAVLDYVNGLQVIANGLLGNWNRERHAPSLGKLADLIEKIEPYQEV